jgi:YbbR domain-containing protein
VTIPVEYRNVPSGWILDNTYPAEIKVTLSGPERSFNFDQSILVASLDMNNVHEGKQSIPITEKQLNMPKSLNINSITPDEFSFRARKVDRVDLPVKVKTKGRLPAHFKLSEIKAVPSTISLIIPLSQKTQITEIVTEPLDLDPINQSTILRLNTVIPSGAQLIDQEHNSIRVSVTIDDK